jgi:hypothetical protein
VVETFKLRPDLLIVLLFISGILVVTYYGRRAVEEKHEKIMTELIDRCMEPAKR